MEKESILQSLFQTLTHEFNWQSQTITVSIETIKHLSFALEDVVMKNAAKPLMFVGFQTGEAFDKVTHRYQQLDKDSEHIYVFAQGKIDESLFNNLTFYPINDTDPINDEWFILILSPTYAVVMSAVERPKTPMHDGTRMFDLLWSFTPEMVKRALDIMLEKITFYDEPHYLARAQDFATRNIPITELKLVNQLTLQMIQYKQDVQNRLHFTHNSLLETYEYTQRIIDLSPGLIVAMNTAQEITLANQSIVALLEHDVNDLLGKTIATCCATDTDYDQFAMQIAQVLTDEQHVAIWESNIKSHTGKLFVIEWHMRLIQNQNRQTILAIGRNITELRNTQRTLVESQQQLEDIMESVKSYIYMLQYDSNQQTLIKAYSSPVGTQLTGYLPDELTQDSDFWLDHIIHPEDRTIAENILDRLFKGQSTEIQYRIVCKDGSVRWVNDSTRAYIDEMNGIVSIYGTVEDITERLNLQDELLKQEKLRLSLEHENQALKMRNEFITTVSHEFRTPLATILSATEMLENYEDRMTPENKKNRYKIITEQVDQLRRMLDDINIIIESQTQIIFQPQPQNLEVFIQSTIAEVNKLTETSREIIVDIKPMPEVMFDDRLMRDVMKNLLINAINYSTGNRPIQLKAHIDSDMLVIRVHNYGIGIDPEDGERIFESFYRGKNHPQHQGGTGLGLRIVKDFVDRHGGTVDFTSSPEKGTCFRIRIPYAYSE